MKTYLIDWGKNTDRAPFALLQTDNLARDVLKLGDGRAPDSISEFEIPLCPETNLRYTEIGVME